MKKHLLPLLALSLLAATAACSKDDSPQPLESKTYTGTSALTMTYDSAPMSGMSVTLSPGDAESTMTIFSKVDLASLGDDFKGLPEIQAPGPLPGSPTLALTTPLEAKGKGYRFSGSGETDYASYSYSGTVDRETMQLNFTDVLLKEQRLAGLVYKPSPIERNSDGLGWKSSPFHFVWEANLPAELDSLQPAADAAGDMLQLLAQLPVIPVYNGTAYMSLAQAVASGLQTLAFRADGCLVASYLQTNNGTAMFTHAPICMLQYLPVSESMIRLYVNPTDVLSVVLINNTHRDPNIPANPFGAPRLDQSATGSAGLDADVAKAYLKQFALKTLLKLAPMLPAGIPVDYTPTSDGMNLYLGQQAVLPVVQAILAEIAADAQLQAIIAQLVQADPTLAQYLPQLKQLFSNLPAILAATTRLELGLSLVQVKG